MKQLHQFLLYISQYLLLPIIYLCNSYAFAQYEFYSSSGDSNLVLMQSNTCSSNYLGKFQSFIDIAITPNGTLYGVDFSLYKIDISTGTTLDLGFIITNEGEYVDALGLVGLNNDFLLADHLDSLVKISVIDATAENIGYIGYWCNGDFAFFNGKLYMADYTNHLIEIILDPITYSIVSVTDVGLMNTKYESVFSLFTSFEECGDTDKSLFAIDGDKVYKLNTSNAYATEVCNIPNQHYSFGAASTYDFEKVEEKPETIIPNVFTPNNDGKNDLFAINKSFKHTTIFNRWGHIIFQTTFDGLYWDGRTSSGIEVPSGTYFYIIELFDECIGEVEIAKGTFSLLR
jgi:gliding motility-associated-like protein